MVELQCRECSMEQLRCGVVAMWGSCGVEESQHGGVAARESCGWGGCGVGKLRCEGLTVCVSCGA